MAYAGFSKGGKNLGILKTKIRFSLRFSPFFCPDLGEDQKKKGLHRDSARFSAQIYCPNSKGGGMTQFCALLLGIYTLKAVNHPANSSGLQ